MTDHDTPRCHYAGKGQPRMLRTHQRDCEDAGCDGCVACPERHCRGCGRAHVTVDGRGTDQICVDCLRTVRDDIDSILEYSTRLLGEAIVAGINSTAAMLAGPAAEREAFRRRIEHAFTAEGCRERYRCPMHRPTVTVGPACEACTHSSCVLIRRADCVTVLAIHQDNRDELHPLTVLGEWEDQIRAHLDQPSTDRITVTDAAGYIDGHLTRLAHDEDFPFEDLAAEVHACRVHLEQVLHDGEQVDRGAPCPMCGRANLEKDHGDTEAEDRWRCPRRDCGAAYTEEDYRSKVQAVYVRHAKHLTASDIAATYRVPEGTVRRWASGPNPSVKTRGRDSSGRQLYDVAQVLAQRDRRASA